MTGFQDCGIREVQPKTDRKENACLESHVLSLIRSRISMIYAGAGEVQTAGTEDQSISLLFCGIP